MMKSPIQIIFIGCFFGLYSYPVYSYKDDIGYTSMVTQLGAGIPDAAGIMVSQTEADTDGVTGSPYRFFPDPDNTQFSGKFINNAGNLSYTLSPHATTVGTLFYGNNAMASGISQINAYEVNNWLQSNFLMFGSNLKPQSSNDRIGNHSWVGATGNLSYDTDILRRLDWVIETDDFVHVAGSRNSTGNNSNLLSGAFNVIAVGKTNGLHSTGSNAIDADYIAGRNRPHIVAPANTTSSATPIIGASAALLMDVGHNTPGLSNGSSTNRSGNTIYNAENSETIKACLLAGADRTTVNTETPDNISDYRLDPAHQSANGLDTRFGAGQVNIFNSYQIISAGEQDSLQDSGLGNIGDYGFDYDPSFGGGNGSNASANYTFSSGPSPEIFYASLVWHIDIAGGNRFFDGSAILYDLDFYLYDVTAAQTLVASSSSHLDNTENLWVNLQPNRHYLLQVISAAGQGDFNWDYAIAWQRSVDTDSDMIPDKLDPDDDNDGVSDAAENALGTDPLNADTDNDNLSDGDEFHLYGTSPLDPDSDDDGLRDDVEINNNLDPTVSNKGHLAPRGLPDDVLNAADLLLLYRFINGLATATAIETVLADINGDGELNLLDALLMQKDLLAW